MKKRIENKKSTEQKETFIFGWEDDTETFYRLVLHPHGRLHLLWKLEKDAY